MMPHQVKGLIDELSNDPKYIGECPTCGEQFKLKNAGLFYSDFFSSQGKTEKEKFEVELEILQEDIKKKKESITKGAPQKSIEVKVGKIVEKVGPILPGFPYHINDCRFLGEPIDYLIFDGLTVKNLVDNIVFSDVKTGSARLKTNQRQIRDAVRLKKVELELYKL
jgi:predicted Holliday junction resolvase-like endonuclease